MNERDLAKKPFTEDEIVQLLKGRKAEDFINPKSLPYKNLGLKDQSLSRDEIVKLLAKEVNLFKRPIVITADQVIFGFNPADYEKLLK